MWLPPLDRMTTCDQGFKWRSVVTINNVIICNVISLCGGFAFLEMFDVAQEDKVSFFSWPL